MIERRKFLTGLISLVAAPAIVRLPTMAEPIDWVDVPGTDLALKGSPACILRWVEIFRLKSEQVSYQSMPLYREALLGDWEYITSPNYIEAPDSPVTSAGTA